MGSAASSSRAHSLYPLDTSPKLMQPRAIRLSCAPPLPRFFCSIVSLSPSAQVSVARRHACPGHTQSTLNGAAEGEPALPGTDRAPQQDGRNTRTRLTTSWFDRRSSGARMVDPGTAVDVEDVDRTG